MDCCGNKNIDNEKTPWYKNLKAVFTFGKDKKENQGNATYPSITEKIALIGSPNVGKSALFNKLTGAYVTVSNYPGTTVEVTRGKGKIGSRIFEFIDTPGMYSLQCITEEEKVTRDLLFCERPKLILHVIDAKNTARMLPLTMQLIEAGMEVILVLNIMDEAEELGISIDLPGLERELGIPVISTAAALNRGIDILKERVGKYDKAA